MHQGTQARTSAVANHEAGEQVVAAVLVVVVVVVAVGPRGVRGAAVVMALILLVWGKKSLSAMGCRMAWFSTFSGCSGRSGIVCRTSQSMPQAVLLRMS